MADNPPTTPSRGHRFGTFGGVFTPSILTILGVILFLRSGYIVGEAGILGALGILLLAEGIVILTALSMAAVATNTPVRGGGAYFLISRALGPAFGGSIGLALYFAQALSVPFYILGFTEALAAAIPALQDYRLVANLVTAGILFTINAVGAAWAIKTQYVVMVLLGLALVSMLGGSLASFDPATFQANLAPRPGAPLPFWVLFAIYFPAVTGIMTGVNMSGDLRDPSRSLVRGTLWAIAVGGLVYGLQIVLAGGSQARDTLVHHPYTGLLDNALLGTSFLIAAGMYAASLSSAGASFLGAPRVLQALARDRVMRVVEPFARGTARHDEPIRGLWGTFAITVLVLALASADRDGSAFNLMAAVVAMFFLGTYGMVNLAAFVEAFSGNPSFRPRFALFHWSTALLGAISCGIAMLLIDPMAAAIAGAVVALLYAVITHGVVHTTYGDARSGFVYQALIRNLALLRTLTPHPKNWRPRILILSGNPQTRLDLVHLGVAMEGGTGIVTVARIILGRFQNAREVREQAIAELEDFIAGNRLLVYPEVLIASDLDEGLRSLLQVHAIGPIKPNLVLVGWPKERSRFEPFAQHLNDIRALGRSVIVVIDRGLPEQAAGRRIDIWWRGKQNGSLMLILAYLMVQSWEWRGARIRILRAVESENAREPAAKALLRLTQVARMEDTDTQVVLQPTGFGDALAAESRDAALIFLGFEPVDISEAAAFHQRFSDLLQDMPTAVLVSSNGEADLQA